jgi:hypothetical protein
MTHHCHWPGCKKAVPPKLWGCLGHWKALPSDLQRRIWQTYVPGQEITKTPSREYLEAADAVQRWIKQHEAAKAAKAQPQQPLF